MLARLLLASALLGACVLRADDSFTKSLSPEDFQAAGLSKLTPEELARLDALVKGEKAGAEAKAKEETTRVVTAKVTEQVRKQTQAEDRKAEQKKGVTERIVESMKVVLKPGTEIEYTTLDTTLVPPFRGWRKGTIITLSNGQRWVVTDEDSYWSDPVNAPLHVRIVPGVLGTFFLEIEKGGRPRAKYFGMVPGASPPGETPAPESKQGP